tara:strand:+ start:1981 stop:3411 length:1431 start_codon:yes stop_codon:yes gene_type:complete
MIKSFKIYFFFFLFSFIFSYEALISPIAYSIYHSEGNSYKYDKTYTSIGGWGLLLKYKNKNLTIKSDFYNNRIYNIMDKPNFFNDNQGLSRFKKVDYNSNEIISTFDFDISNLNINYNHNNLDLYLGKFNTHWGYGNSSLTISNKSPSFPKLGFNLKINENINFEYFHGSLKSNILDTAIKDYYVHDIPFGNRSPNLNRFIAAHRLIIEVNPKLNISLNELVIYGVRNLDIHYCLPFLPFWSLQGYLGDLDNIVISMDFNYNLNEQKSIYGSLLIDEIRPSEIFSENNRNWFGYQLGVNFKNIIFNDDNLISELNWTDHRIYRHRFDINNHYNHGYPVGFWGGPHSEEIYLNYSFKKFDFLFNIEYSNAKRGILTDMMLDNQYIDENEQFTRYDDGYEKLSNLEISINKHIYKGVVAKIGINLIDWNNAGFDTSGLNNENLTNIKKESLFFGLSYNYDFEKEESFIHKDSFKYILK